MCFICTIPESQLGDVPKADFLERIRDAFTFLESAVVAGEIQYYGVATWNAFRQEASARDSMQLAELVQIAQEIAGGRHRFRFVQLPFNLGMTEALTLGNQMVAGRKRTITEAADELDITLIASASLLQGKWRATCRDLWLMPSDWRMTRRERCNLCAPRRELPPRSWACHGRNMRERTRGCLACRPRPWTSSANFFRVGKAPDSLRWSYFFSAGTCSMSHVVMA